MQRAGGHGRRGSRANLTLHRLYQGGMTELLRALGMTGNGGGRHGYTRLDVLDRYILIFFFPLFSVSHLWFVEGMDDICSVGWKEAPFCT
ncbi:hypothetical protein VTK73DRAFT_6127 [Phialemonium thermophilum]|uniref:Uncharacterized protein n=1 Tax=Phialemonium thermophilum TaxID=223376 RepID=A0ABR3V0M1_9PEZI